MGAKLIIDAGGTSSTTALLSTDRDHPIITSTQGINVLTTDQLEKDLEQLVGDYKSADISEVFYYGAGCANEHINLTVKDTLDKCLPSAKSIEVNSDLLGAARAIHQDQSGIIAILGTGSNVGSYDGDVLYMTMSPGGYLLGDEGSGYQIGKEIYKRYTRGRLSEESALTIAKESGISMEQAVQHLYQADSPKSVLSNFSKMLPFLHMTEREEILDMCFSSFVEELLLPAYKETPDDIGIVGSIAHAYEDQLTSILEHKNISSQLVVVKDPMSGMIKYHG